MYNAYRDLYEIMDNDPLITIETLRGTPCYGVFGVNRGYYIHGGHIQVYRCSNMGIGEEPLGVIIPPKKDYEYLLQKLEEIRNQ